MDANKFVKQYKKDVVEQEKVNAQITAVLEKYDKKIERLNNKVKKLTVKSKKENEGEEMTLDTVMAKVQSGEELNEDEKNMLQAAVDASKEESDMEEDAGEEDAGEEDAGEEDAGEEDAGEEDAGEEDAGEEDAGEEDAGEEDAGEETQDTEEEQDSGEEEERPPKEPKKPTMEKVTRGYTLGSRKNTSLRNSLKEYFKTLETKE